MLTCPSCRGNDVHTSKRGFGVGKAAVGAIVTGGIGLLAGGIGANKLKLTCLGCGAEWKPGEIAAVRTVKPWTAGRVFLALVGLLVVALVARLAMG